MDILLAILFFVVCKLVIDRLPIKGKKDEHEEQQVLKTPISAGILLRQPNEAVLMLDFDGVLHPSQSGTMIRLPMLESTLRDFPGVDIVISSSWRLTCSLKALTAFFSQDIQPRIIGITPGDGTGRRGDEIAEFVSTYKIEKWIALDDCPQEFSATEQANLVQTYTITGITEEVIKEFRLRLSALGVTKQLRVIGRITSSTMN